MPNSYFRFKQFAVRQERSAMKVGTDGVMLGAWVEIGLAKTILDIGTGTGLIALMLAQRSNATIDAVEIDEQSAIQATENVENSRWKNRVRVYQSSFQSFAKHSAQQYDLIVSNPPYFIKSLKPPAIARTVARHNDQLPHSELLTGVSRLLATEGRFVGIFPYIEGNVFVAEASAHNLFCNKKLNILGKTNGTVKRVMLEFSRVKSTFSEDNLAIRNTNGEYTPEYIDLTKDFYLAF